MKIIKEKKRTVMVSGGMDPIHYGHVRMIQEAAKYGDVIVVLNSDKWLFKKKGFVFMDFDQRAEIALAIKGVTQVVGVDDKDGTVCEAIRRLKPDYFANGGDRGKNNTPEVSLCQENGIKLLWGVGGSDKVASSSELVESMKKLRDPKPLPPLVKRKVSDK